MLSRDLRLRWWLGAAAILPDIASAAPGANALESVRVLATEPDSFEYLFTGASAGADGETLLAFNHRNGRTWFVGPGEWVGAFRVAAYEAKTNRVYMPSLNTTVEESAGTATLEGPGGARIVLQQGRPLALPGRVAWLVSLGSGLWWSVREQDVFFMGDTQVFVEEIDEDGVAATAGGDLLFILRMASGEKDGLNRLWADRKRQERQAQEQARQRQQAAAAKVQAAKEAAAVAAYAPAPLTYERGPHVAIRGAPYFFYGCDYRYPDAFKAVAIPRGAHGCGPPFIVLPTHFRTGWCGTSLSWP